MFRRTRTTTVVEAEYCESCAQVCTPACQARAQRDRTRTAAIAARAGLPF